MFLLLSNDDGYLSPGLRAMADALRDQVARLVVMAPDRDCSGASHSLTLKRPLSVSAHEDGVYSVDGTPSDCVHLAVSGFFDERPHMVISGINRGANMGDDVLYSGTVAAAFEGRHLGLPSIAVSNVAHQPRHWQASAQVVRDLFAHIRAYPLPSHMFLNVNIPDLPYGDIRGFRSTVLGRRAEPGALVETLSPRDKTLFWIGRSGDALEDEGDTDFQAVADGFVSVTPLQFNLTDFDQLGDVARWLEGL